MEDGYVEGNVEELVDEDNGDDEVPLARSASTVAQRLKSSLCLTH